MIGYKTKFYRSTDGVSFSQIAKLIDMENYEISRDTFEKTLIDNSDGADGYKSYGAGLKDAGEVSLTLEWSPTDTGQQDLSGDLDTDADRWYRVEYPDGTTATFKALLTGWGKSLPIAERITRNCKFKLSGKPTVSAVGV